jgi:lysophospholipase L1-like esterase
MNGEFYFVCLAILGLCLTGFAHGATTAPVAPAAHDSTVWEKDIRAFEAADRKHMPAPGGVLFVGSSSIRFWKTEKAFPGRNVINRGFGGSWSCDSVYYADRIVLPYKPRTIIFYAGDNDIDGGARPQEVADSFRQFVGKVHSVLPKTTIVFISIKPSIARWKLWNRMRKANGMVRRFAERTPRVKFVDISKEMLGPNGRPRKELFRKDGLHLNVKGYAIWNQKIEKYVTGK